ncbi:MAG: hypothetical protein ACRCTZ_19275 [Sarcina sp.]
MFSKEELLEISAANFRKSRLVADFIFLFESQYGPYDGMVIKEKFELECVSSKQIHLDDAVRLFNEKKHRIIIVTDFARFQNFATPR